MIESMKVLIIVCIIFALVFVAGLVLVMSLGHRSKYRIRPMIPRGDIVSVGSSKAGVHRYQAQISLALSCT